MKCILDLERKAVNSVLKQNEAFGISSERVDDGWVIWESPLYAVVTINE